ncbi:hypothetical protein BU26DRAFT_531347 [Trematosphaeria pertusa]|uniref:Mannose-1-phosphate guanyltransferase n=1 Tax=Trematosphaeria pertusa TaxID=390896 RepID=A0A6A6IB48_9PLEO|nr:uncharacterized protein BU26DRAFT_531347 [Trematosphaeria pertusa]KAF2247795.1 hypothetical protein BU26DRAFT_531347 [Trematosphaeria pertusa]
MLLRLSTFSNPTFRSAIRKGAQYSGSFQDVGRECHCRPTTCTVPSAPAQAKTKQDEEHVYGLTLSLTPSISIPLGQMREAYFPKHLNRTPVHLTLFHALPHSRIDIIDADLDSVSSCTRPFSVSTGRPLHMRRGIAIGLGVGEEESQKVRDQLRRRWLPWLSDQDSSGWQPHWTLMNKVDEQKKVEQAFDTVRRILFDNVHEGRAVGLDLWRYDNGGWEWFKDYQFPEKGKAPAKREESAIILVGGFGTRLRPLTLTYPKPLVEFANKPMIQHQIEALAAAGVTDIVLAVNYRPEIMTEALKTYEKQYNVNIEFSVETEPLGTAGPLKLAEAILGKDDSPFFVLNSDVTCEYPFKKLVEFHKQHGDEGTIVVTKVEEPSKYGVVVHKPNHPSRIDRFVEKPVEFVGNRINAGIYLLNPTVLKRIELRPTSIEQETFPAICKDGQLHSFDLEGFWMDVGQPKDFLSGTCLYLSSLTRKNSKLLTPASQSYVHGGNVLVDPTAKIGKGCRIGPNVTIGPNVVIGDGVRLQRCVLLKNSRVKDHAWIKSTIVGWNSTVGKWARLENVTVLGDDVSIGDEVYVNGGSILPHKSIKSNIDSKLIVTPSYSIIS